MAYRSRGGGISRGGSSVGRNSSRSSVSSTSRISGLGAGDLMYYSTFHFRIPLDNTYVLMQMAVTFLIIIVAIVTFTVAYESTITDPIADLKNLYINSHLIVLGICLGITVLVNIFSKSKESLIKRLIITALISIIAMLVFLGIKINLDTTYTQSKFEQIYEEQNPTQTSDKKTKLDIDLLGVTLKTEKEFFVKECGELYAMFNIKSYVILMLHLILNALLIYQFTKLYTTQKKKEKLDKDSIVLFDEEENVKY